MMKDFNPRQAVRGLLQSIAPQRPLFLPIVFSLGARIENVSLRNFLTNPTKISNALRQIRTHLRSDGITCYFDPYLEAESLGGVLDWKSDASQPSAGRNRRTMANYPKVSAIRMKRRSEAASQSPWK